MVVPAHAQQAVQRRLNAVSKEGHFPLQVETVFSPYLPSHCSGATKICDMAFHAHALKAVQVTLKSASNESHFTLDGERLFRPYLQSH
jgi:hypothetical protein